LVLLLLTLSQVGGLENATQDVAKMVPPRNCSVSIQRLEPGTEELAIPFGTWLATRTTDAVPRRVFRTAQRAEVRANEQAASYLDTEGQIQREIPVLEIVSPHEVDRIVVPSTGVYVADVITQNDYAYGAGQAGTYVMPPGPSAKNSLGFLPLGLAVSFFFFWTFSGSGQPSGMVLLMAFNSTLTLRRAMMMVAVYFSLIYLPLVVIFCCGRVLLPGMEIESDRIMPALVEHVTRSAGWPWLAGLLVAAPFAAVMSTVDSFLLMISSAIVCDVYQRDINPAASEATIKRLTYAATVLVGVAAFLGALNPPEYLQNIIVFTGGGLSACFLVPVALALYWPRFNAGGAIASMSAGFLIHVVLYVGGWFWNQAFQPLRIAGFDPLIPELIVSLLVGCAVALRTAAPTSSLVHRFFYKRNEDHGGR